MCVAQYANTSTNKTAWRKQMEPRDFSHTDIEKNRKEEEKAAVTDIPPVMLKGHSLLGRETEAPWQGRDCCNSFLREARTSTQTPHSGPDRACHFISRHSSKLLRQREFLHTLVGRAF